MVVSCDRMTGPGFETISLAGNEPSSGKWVTEKRARDAASEKWNPESLGNQPTKMRARYKTIRRNHVSSGARVQLCKWQLQDNRK